MSFTIIWKATGEEITFPTPSEDKPATIDSLPWEREEFIFIEGDEFQKMIDEWEALPWYKRFFYKTKELWHRYVV
jgi:hypothetical protein